MKSSTATRYGMVVALASVLCGVIGVHFGEIGLVIIPIVAVICGLVGGLAVSED